ncbi:MAG: hypothetical protein M3O62_19890 [Pseudomonadota bacterium]|nr:hypothetical protein [Pseudomonadota bacterium]
MGIKIGGPVGPKMPVFIAGLIVGIALTVAYYHFSAVPPSPAVEATAP